MNRTQRDRLHIAETTLSLMVAAIESGESIGLERLGDIKETLAFVKNEEHEPTLESERYFIIPVFSFAKKFDSLDTPQIVVQILRDALGDFVFNRSPVDEYVRRRYAYMTPMQRADKQAQVLFRTRLAQDFALEHVEVAMYDPRLTPPEGR